MNKKVAILTSSTNPANWESTAKKFSVSLGGELAVVRLQDLLFDIGESIKLFDTRTGRALSEFTGIYFQSWQRYRELAMAAAVYAESVFQTIQPLEAKIFQSDSKLSEMMVLAVNGIQVPRTWFSLNKASLESYVKKEYQGALIVKDMSGITGKKGINNYKIDNTEQLIETLNKQTEVNFIVQPYIENEGDYRYVVLGGKVRLIIKRKAIAGMHLNNTSQGAQSSLILQPDKFIDQGKMIAEKSATLLNRNVAGVDILVAKGNGTRYVLEVNRGPQLVTGEFIEVKEKELYSFFHNEYFK